MKRCIIITSYVEGSINQIISLSPDDYIICADGGYSLAKKENITPSIVIGDFDSLKEAIPNKVPKITAPTHKDVTDTALCLDHALSEGFTNVMIIGGMGGRLDHTMANIQNLFHYAKKGILSLMTDQQNLVTILVDDETIIPKMDGYKLSLFSYSPSCEGVSVSGVTYPLSGSTLTNNFPLGVSNEFDQDSAYIRVEKGELLIILSKDI